MTIESDVRAPRGITSNEFRGRHHLPYAREQMASVSTDIARPGCRQCAAALTSHADVAQAALFADILRAEHAELGAAAAAQRREAGCAPDRSLRLQARMREIRRLLDALEKRFPSSG